MLSTNRKADCVLCNSLICKLFIIELAVSCAGRVNYKRLYICNICKQTENLEVINKLPCFFPSPFDVECKNRSSAMREILLIKSMVRMIGKGRVIYFFDFWMLTEEFYNFFLYFLRDDPVAGSKFQHPAAKGRR